MKDALDADLDAYLERELLVQPAAEAKGKASPSPEQPTGRLQSVLALAAQEEQWLEAKPSVGAPAENSEDVEGGGYEIPEHLQVKPAPEASVAPPFDVAPFEAPWTPLPGLAMAPHLAQQGLNRPAAPTPGGTSRAPWLVIGALSGVTAASVFVAAMLWISRDSLPERAQVMAAYVPTGAVATVSTLPLTVAPTPVLFVKDSPLPRQPEPLVADWVSAANGTVEALPGPVVFGRGGSTRESAPPALVPAASGESPSAALAHAVAVPALKALPDAAAIARPSPVAARKEAEATRAPEKVQARRAPAAEARKPWRVHDDPALDSSDEEELPEVQAPVAPAPAVAKAEPAEAMSEPEDDSHFDEDFARKLGFTPDSVRKPPESTGVKSVWVPPDPDAKLPATLTPGEIQQVVLANQPDISSCIQQYKEAIPGLVGGRFTVRWFVLPSGGTQQVAMQTKALKGTALATCIEERVRGWKFPKHRTQMGPIRFPFIF